MRLTDIGTVKKIMEENGLAFKKQFGQNFLINEAIPRKIAETGAGEYVLEIGPGIGTLTYELAKKAKKVVAVEIDTTLIPVLGTTLAEFDNITVINADIMKTDIKALVQEQFGEEKICVCANLPYYITTPILMRLLEAGAAISAITVMIQREVADRICAPAGSPDYGAISAAVAYYGEAHRAFRVSAGSFMPAPKVDSAVIRIDLYDEPPYDVISRDVLFRIIKAAFGMRRKTLVNTLSGEFGISKEQMTDIVTSCGFAADVRGEKLSVADFTKIENVISKAIPL